MNARQWCWLALALLAHGLLSAGISLSPDEAHYALYASHPAWSYFDHPPLVGWLQMPAVALGGADWLLRVWPTLSWVASAWLLVRLTGTLVPRTGRLDPGDVALVVFLCSPLLHLLGLAWVPDTPLMPLGLAVMAVTWQMRDPEQASHRSLWLLLGALLGLIGLSKYTGVLFAFSVLAVLWQAHGWRLFTWPRTWAAGLLALVLISPVLVWNAQHDWMSFSYQLHHAGGQQSWSPWKFTGFAVVQIVGYGLLVLPGLIAAVARARKDAPTRAVLLFCLAFGAPLLLIVGSVSGRGAALPHWTAPAWLALLPAVALGWMALWPRVFKALGALQIVTCLALGLAMASGGPEESPSAPNPLTDLHGWPEAAERAMRWAEHNGTSELAVANWSLASRLAWYARPLSVHVAQDWTNQFTLWFGNLSPGDTVIYVDWSQLSSPPAVGVEGFERCDLQERVPTDRWDRTIAHFDIYHCVRWRSAEATTH